MRWILGVIGLLAANVAAMVVLATAASIGHSEVIPDYYDHAAHYDDVMAQQRANARLGWRLTTTMSGGEVVVRVADEAGLPVAGALVRVTGLARAHAGDRFERVLAPRGPGSYAAAADRWPGIHDLEIAVTLGDARFADSAVVDAR